MNKKNPIIYQFQLLLLSTLWHDFRFNLYISCYIFLFYSNKTHTNTYFFVLVPFEWEITQMFEAFPRINIKYAWKNHTPDGKKSISISDHFHHNIFIALSKSRWHKSWAWVSLRCCQVRKQGGKIEAHVLIGPKKNTTQKCVVVLIQKAKKSYFPFKIAKFECGMVLPFPSTMLMVSSMTLFRWSWIDVNRHIWFDFEPISYRSYGWKSIHRREIFVEIIHDLRDKKKSKDITKALWGLDFLFSFESRKHIRLLLRRRPKLWIF